MLEKGTPDFYTISVLANRRVRYENFFKTAMEWEIIAALVFSSSIIICAIITLITGATAIPISTVASFLIVSSVGAFIQFFAFSNRIIKKMHYTMRMIVFTVLFFIMLAINAIYFEWFPIQNSIFWLTFVGIFLVIFIVMIIGFEIYYRAMGKKYDGLLGQYRKHKEAEKDS